MYAVTGMPHAHGTGDARPSSTIEDYLVTVYRLGVAGEPVIGARIADALGVAPATVTEMLGRLRAAGLLAPGRPIELTADGLSMARTLVSRHRLAERFLVDVLGFGWDQVHEEAHRLEHALSAQVTERLAALLGHPTTCPHGHPIMEDGAAEPDLPLVPLSGLRSGDVAVVRRVATEDSELLALLTSLGIGLGTELTVAGTDAYGGPVRLEVAGERRALGPRAAREVLVEVRVRTASGSRPG